MTSLSQLNGTSYQDETFKDLADLLGIDIRNLDKDEVLAIVTEAYEIVAYIADDAEFRELFIQFGKEISNSSTMRALLQLLEE